MVKGVVEDVGVNNYSPQQQKGGVVNFHTTCCLVVAGKKEQ